MSKTVVAYARISNEDQSHFSIDGQKEQFIEYCEKNNYNLLQVFTDEGQSAKDFERKEWKELEKYLKLHYKNIDYLLVMKYDRFSRNVGQALSVIGNLEQVYNIRIISISEPIGLPPESPFYFQLRTQMLLQAHVERLIIKDRTLFGMRKAKKDGRYLGKAPYGYTNNRDNQKKPIIEVNEYEAGIIRKIFNWFLEGYTVAEIKRKAKTIGFNQTGKDSVYRILTNRVYIGLIKIKACEEQSEHYIKGIHTPIIDEDDFYRVQSVLARPELPKRQYNDLAYLKSAIICPECHKPLTCGKSKGRNKYYWYYECSTHRKSYRLETAHNKFDEILSEISFSDDQLQYMEQKIRKNINQELKNNQIRVPNLTKRLSDLQKKKERLEDKYFSGKLDDNTFLNWQEKMKSEIDLLNQQISYAQVKEQSYWDRFSEKFVKLKNIHNIFEKADIQEKHSFIEKGFGKLLSYDGNIYRTTFLHPVFEDKYLILSDKELLKLHKKTEILQKSPSWVNDGSRTHDLRNHNPTL